MRVAKITGLATPVGAWLNHVWRLAIRLRPAQAGAEFARGEAGFAFYKDIEVFGMGETSGFGDALERPVGFGQELAGAGQADAVDFLLG